MLSDPYTQKEGNERMALKVFGAKCFGGKNVAHPSLRKRTPFKCPSCQGILYYLVAIITLSCIKFLQIIICGISDLRLMHNSAMYNYETK